MARKKGRKAKGKRKWIQAARERMEEKGTVGKFGKATKKKISKGKKSRSLTKRREAVFAENMKKAAAKRRGKKRHARKR